MCGTTSRLVRDAREDYVTLCPAHSLWFKRFIFEMYKRMENEVRQDKAFTLNVMHRLVGGIEEEYSKSDRDKERGEVTDMTVFIVAAFLGVL